MSFIAENPAVIIEKIDELANLIKELIGEIDINVLVKAIIDGPIMTMSDVYKMSSQLNVEKFLSIQDHHCRILQALRLKDGSLSEDHRAIIMSHEIIVSILNFSPKAFQNISESEAIGLITKRFNKVSVEAKISFIEIFEENLFNQIIRNFIKERYQPKRAFQKQWSDVVSRDDDDEKMHSLPAIRLPSPAESIAEERNGDDMSSKQAVKFDEIVESVRSFERLLHFKRKDAVYSKVSPHLMTSWSKLLSIVCKDNRYLLPSNKDSYSHENFEIWHLGRPHDGSIVRQIIAPVRMRYVLGLYGFWYSIDSHNICHVHYFDENWDWRHTSITSNGTVKEITNEKLLELCAGSRK
jgi:hypothetical protein